MVQTPTGLNQQGMNDQVFTPAWYIMSRITKMSDAKASDNVAQAYSYFEDALKILTPFMEPMTKKDIQLDYLVFRKVRDEIQNNTKIDDISKRDELNKLKRSFMETHELYLYIALPKAGVIRLEEEGEIDFEKLAFDKVQRIVRSKSISEGVDKYANPEQPTD